MGDPHGHVPHRPGVALRQAMATQVAAVLSVMVLFASCSTYADRHEILLAGETMGSRWTVKLAGPLPLPAEVLQAQVQRHFEAVDAALSTFRKDSALSRFNDHVSDDWQPLDPELALVMGYALELARQTGGAYDVTLGPVVDLWGFGPAPRRSEPPGEAELAAALRQVGWQRIEMGGEGARARRPAGMRVDLSSLGKGRGVDRVAQYLRSQGIDDFLIDLSGKLRAQGLNGHGEPWQVAVEEPGADDLSGAQRVVTRPVGLHDEAIATAGTYRRYFLTDGRSYSHLLDARTGRPVAYETASATVVAADALQADALCTVLMVLPPDEALAFADGEEIAALLLLERGGKLVAQASRAWRLRYGTQENGAVRVVDDGTR